MNKNNIWSFFDFLLMTSGVLLLVMGIVFSILGIIRSIQYSKIYGWKAKKLWGGETPISFLIGSSFLLIGGVYIMLIDNFFIKYLNGTTQFFGY